MKVCPHCKGITEEYNAIKCSICGRSIKDEQDYTQEELENDLVLSEIDRINKKNKDRKKITKIAMILGGIMLGIIIFSLPLILEPTGHIEIADKNFEVEVGQIIPIEIKLSEKISEKNIRMNIVNTNYKDGSISFNYKIEDSILYIEAIKEDNLQLLLYVKDDGTQKNYNNLITITIINKSK